MRLIRNTFFKKACLAAVQSSVGFPRKEFQVPFGHYLYRKKKVYAFEFFLVINYGTVINFFRLP
jgi:hypothetical protein